MSILTAQNYTKNTAEVRKQTQSTKT